MIYAEIFWVFFKISIMSFGGVFGVLPQLGRWIVDGQGWMTHDRFIQSYVLGQFVPGPNMAMCPLIGYWVAGGLGWLAAFVGIYTAPVLIMGGVSWTYSRYRSLEWVRRMELSLRPLVFGLILSSTLQLWWKQSVGFGLSPLKARLAALGLSALLLLAYRRRWLGPLLTIFAGGALWWLFHWGLGALPPLI